MRALRTGLLVTIALFARVGTAEASDLADFVNDLYGGDGITLVSFQRNQPTDVNYSTFQQSSIAGLEALTAQILSTLSPLSLSSAPPGFTFDMELGVPIANAGSLGPLIADRAETLGRHRLDLAVSYSRIDYKRLQGHSLDDLTLHVPSGDFIPPGGDGVVGPVPPCDPSMPLLCTSPSAVELDELELDLDVKIQRDILALFAKYGVLDNWDVEIVVPLERVHVEANSRAQVVRNVFNPQLSELLNQFDPSRGSDYPNSSSSGTATGIGDVLLRSKLNLLRDHERLPDLAVQGQISLPTGDRDDLMGTGETAFRLTAIASKPYGWFTPHLNVGYEVATGSRELDNLRYAVGFDARLHRRLTFALDVVGVWGPNVDLLGNDLVDVSAGVRWKIWGGLILDMNFQVPLNRNQGLRPDFVPSVGFDYVFGGE